MGPIPMGVAFALAMMTASMAIGGCSDCEPAVAELRAFVLDETHQTCATDDDCVVVQAGCSDLDIAFCGQVSVNRTAASSRELWNLIDEATCEEPCSTCAAALVPGCTLGRCFSASNR